MTHLRGVKTKKKAESNKRKSGAVYYSRISKYLKVNQNKYPVFSNVLIVSGFFYKSPTNLIPIYDPLRIGQNNYIRGK